MNYASVRMATGEGSPYANSRFASSVPTPKVKTRVRVILERSEPSKLFPVQEDTRADIC